MLGRPAARGAALAAAGLTKFAPLALAPLFATYPARARRRLPRPLALSAGAAFAVTAALRWPPCCSTGGPGTFYERTLGFQRERGSPFRLWGLYDLPGRADRRAGRARCCSPSLSPSSRAAATVIVAALGAAVLIALQLGVTHWFYLYLVWFLPLRCSLALLRPRRAV